jgi:hypothetical protein
MSTLSNLSKMRVVKVGPSLRERLARLVAAQHHHTVVARLRRFREELQKDMRPEPWTELEAPMVLLLSDVCEALALTKAERAAILGKEGEQALEDVVETQFTPRPAGLNERQVKALACVRRRGRININAYRKLCPGLSDETLRLDLANLVSRGLLVKKGAKRGTYYTMIV